MDPHAIEVVLRHSTTLVLGGLAGFWAAAVAHAYACRLAVGATVTLHTLVAAARAVALRGTLLVLPKSRVLRRPEFLVPDCSKNASDPSVEFFTGLWLACSLACSALFAAILLFLSVHTPSWQVFIPLAVACWVLLLLALIDARTGYLPDALTLPFLVLGISTGMAQGGWQALIPMTLGLAVGVAVPGLCMGWHWLRHRQAGMGLGDLKLLAGMGVWLGAQGVITALLVACVCGLAYTLCRNRALRLQATYPFGPFLAVGTMFVFLN